MAAKFLSLEEAAQHLGVTSDELSEMRLAGEIFGMRDGSSWKFKSDEVERVINARASGGSRVGGDSGLGLSGIGSGLGSSLSGSKLGKGNEPADHEEIVLLSEAELGQSGPSTSSTVIGQSLPKGCKSQVKLHDSESDLRLAGASDVRLAESGIDLSSAEPSGLPIDLGDSSNDLRSTGSGLLAPESGLSLGEESDLKLTPESGVGSALDLDDNADVLGGTGSGSGSDITHKPSDSGILLLDPGDSGLSLEEAPLNLGGDDMGQTTDFDSGSLSAELKGDDDFLLTPLEESGDDDSDSGSQVIMLDAEGEFDDATATLLASNIPGLLPGSGLEAEGGFGADMVGGAQMSARGSSRQEVVTAYISDLPFSGMSVAGLAACVVALTVCGMMIFDVMRNMWSWNGSYGFSSAIMDMFVK